MENFEPKIIAFLCNWCSYAGADLAGTSRMQYAPNVRVVRVMCSGRIDPTFVLTAFKSGADGVLIGGCHFGDCHYLKGNYKAATRIALLKKMIGQMGIEPDRLWLEWVSAAEGSRFASVINQMTEHIKQLGPFSRNGGQG